MDSLPSVSSAARDSLKAKLFELNCSLDRCRVIRVRDFSCSNSYIEALDTAFDDVHSKRLEIIQDLDGYLKDGIL